MPYGTDSGLIQWLAAQGLELPEGANATVLRQIGSHYVDSAYEGRLQCSRRTGGFQQLLAWPRTGHVISGELVPDDLIPDAWVFASYRAAYLEAIQPGWATGTTDPNRVVKRERVEGAVEVEYFGGQETGSSGTGLGFTADAIIGGMLSVWFCSTGRSANSLFFVI